MAVKLRLQRGGRTNRAHYRLVACDTRERRNGRFIENLGNYDPFAKGEPFTCDEDRVRHWLEHGAIPSLTVAQYLKRKGITVPLSTKSAQRKRRRKKRQAAAATSG